MVLDVFNLQVDKETVSGKCFSRTIPFPCACIYENSKFLKLLGLLQSPKKGISSVLDAALAQPDISGVYLFGGKGTTINSSALLHNSKLAHEPWTTSCNLFMQSKLAVRVKEIST